MDEDELDPRIQVELEKLNSATDVINKLEIELDEANTTFRMLLNECTRRLKVHSSKHGSAIENARPYYEALEIARKAQQDCQQAAVNFQRANEVHEAAKETVALAESRFMSQQPEWRFDSAWQEMLNHATIKVRDAEKQRAESSAYHSQATARYKDAQEKVQLLEQRLRRNVAKSRPYFEEKQRCNEQLAAQKEAVETLAAKVARVKSEYAESLRRLEGISEEIHRKRGSVETGGCGVREPGVGAELVYKGEQEHCDSSRESTFVNVNYNYDAKLNANDVPDVTIDKQFDSVKEDLAIHPKDCIDEGVGKEFRQVVSDFQLHTESSDQNPDVHNDLCIKSDIPQNVNANVLRKISFESLHGLHFNPSRDVHQNDKCVEEYDSENVVANVYSEFDCPSEGASSCVSQGKFSLSINKADGEEIKTEEVVSEDSGNDNKPDISKELENDSTERSDCCKIESSVGVNRTFDQMTALKLHAENKGAKNENSDTANAASKTSTRGIDNETVGAQGDAGSVHDGLVDNVTAVGDNLQKNKTSLESSGEQKLVTASECSNTLFRPTRQPDLELSFCANEPQRKDNDGDSSLEMSVNTRDVAQDGEVPAELGDVFCKK